MGRAPCCDKANVKKGPWSPEEDAKLKGYVEKYGTGGNWITLPQKIGIKRCEKSCRLRWLNYLRLDIKHGGFSEEEDNIICSLYISIGSRWSIIAAQLPGRTDNDIKNYWNTRLKKKLFGRRKQAQASVLTGSIKDTKDGNGIESLSNSAIERLQLHMQLQSLQNPNLSHGASNLSMWPCKLNPIQEKIMQNLQLLNGSLSPLITQHVLTDGPQNVELYGPSNNCIQQVYSLPSNDSISGFDADLTTNMTGSDYIKQASVQFQRYLALQAEMDQSLSNKGADSISVDQAQVNEFESFKDMTTWWSKEFEVNSASSNSWDSSLVFDQEEEEIKF